MSFIASQKEFTLDEILVTLTPLQKGFFDLLDSELAKVEKFYIEREKDAVIYSAALKEQLRELQNHRRIYHEHDGLAKPWERAIDAIPTLRRIFPHSPAMHQDNNHLEVPSNGHTTRAVSPSRDGPPGKDHPHNRMVSEIEHMLDPDEYHESKSKLKKAVLEHYKFALRFLPISLPETPSLHSLA